MMKILNGIVFNNPIYIKKDSVGFKGTTNVEKIQSSNTSIQDYLTNIAKINRINSEIVFGLEPSFEESLENYYRLKPDKYQIDAAESLYKGLNTVVTAPTGTGKTLIAEYIINKNLNYDIKNYVYPENTRNTKRTFYTTPLKALSNQKYYDFVKLYGSDNVGLMTGDIKHNVSAPVVVMTTEIYLNMLQSNSPKEMKNKFGDLGTVILDEFHYMNDKERGGVWEKVIMNSPPTVQLLALSATASNAAQVAEWMQKLNEAKDVSLRRREVGLIEVPSEERHVPLKFYAAKANGDIVPLLERKINIFSLADQLNSNKISDKAKEVLSNLGKKFYNNADPKEGIRALSSFIYQEPKSFDDILYLSKKMTEKNTIYLKESTLLEKLTDSSQVKEKSKKKAKIKQEKPKFTEDEAVLITSRLADVKNRELSPKLKNYMADKNQDFNLSISNTINTLNQANKLPAIVFIFSRDGCKAAMKNYLSYGDSLLTPAESAKVQRVIEHLEQEKGMYFGTDFEKKALLRGVAVHHAGMLPAYKTLIEKLFQEKLLKVVFSTDTLSAGINMPAKTIVITNLSKSIGRDEDGHSVRHNLTPNEFQQMAGRGGRRGIDPIGNVIILERNDETFQNAFQLVTSSADNIKSNYTTSYSSLISYLKNNKTFDKIDKTLNLSFMEDDQKEVCKDEFQRMLEILKNGEFIKDTGNNEYSITQKGLAASKVRGVNEIFLTDLIYKNVLNNLAPAELASVVATLTDINENKSNREDDENAKDYEYEKFDSVNSEIEQEIPMNSTKLKNKLVKVQDVAKDINKAQLAIGFEEKSREATVKKDIAPFIYRWASSSDNDNYESWERVIESMKDQMVIRHEGDFVRTLNNTVDLLNQISEISKDLEINYKPEGSMYEHELSKNTFKRLHDKSKEAVELLKKPPIGDLIDDFDVKEIIKNQTIQEKPVKKK